MTMYVKQSDTPNDLDGVGELQVVAPRNPSTEMHVELAGDVVDDGGSRHSLQLSESAAKRVVHVDLPFAFLEVDDGIWHEASVSSTGNGSDPSSCEMLLGSMNLIDCLVLVTGGFL
jgi:hypothetical protein